MQVNDLLQNGDIVYRVLELQGESALIINCTKRTMPRWIEQSDIKDYIKISEERLCQIMDASFPEIEALEWDRQKAINERYTVIADILPHIANFSMRNKEIMNAVAVYQLSRQTVVNYLCTYLAFQTKAALLPKTRSFERVLGDDEKNFRWALNKFFYTRRQNSLKTVYTLMLKEKYCDEYGVLKDNIPSFYQFRYFYRKHRKLQTYYISRNGIKDYQRNYRPLLGDGVQEYASSVGVGMLDATICDIYLVNEAGALVGRPILTACIDAYSGLCCGYSLSWEGGIYSLRNLMLNIIADKKDWCMQFGINIDNDTWDSHKMPGTLVTDMGIEYASKTFEQIAELGIRVVNLPAFRPELKGPVEKFFDIVQNLYKPHLKGKGVVEKNFQERGVHDYRKDACLTMQDFEKVILRCIIYYNSQRIIANYPYTEEMTAAHVRPYANCIFEWGTRHLGSNLLPITADILVLTLMPRATGQFSRQGLKVNRMRYHNERYVEQYLAGGEVTVAYNPDDVSTVWLIERGEYVCFQLIESRFKGMDAQGVETIRDAQKSLIQAEKYANTQAKIDLAGHILTVAQNALRPASVSPKNIREIRNKEREKAHIDFMKAGISHE